jgi:hypothetical protein
MDPEKSRIILSVFSNKLRFFYYITEVIELVSAKFDFSECPKGSIPSPVQAKYLRT